MLGTKRKDDFELYWQDEKDWLCIVEFLPTDNPEARLFAADIIGYSCYIRAAFSEGAAERKIWGALLSLMASKDQVGRVWDNWLSERLKRRSRSDSRIELRVVRLAADGVWLERIVNAKSKNLKGVEEYLIEMTRIR